MVIADANTMLRCIIGDDPHKIAELDQKRKLGPILYPIEVIAEVVYVLIKVYEVSRNDCANAIIQFLNTRNITCTNEKIVFMALNTFPENKLDFIDNVLYAYHMEFDAEIYSYDKKLLKLINASHQE